MTKKVEAIYENGVLRLLEPLPLAERQRVTVTIGIGMDHPRHSHLDVEFIERARREGVGENSCRGDSATAKGDRSLRADPRARQ